MTTPRPDDVSRLDPLKRVGDEQKQTPTPSQSFESYMEKAASQPGGPGKSTGVSPLNSPKETNPLLLGRHLTICSPKSSQPKRC